ncbi:MAG: hypothetical protein IIC67_04385 [Thaumarchaeota archaeon]|nr:hypothetical protein [Nitrososphaerota archaeon]
MTQRGSHIKEKVFRILLNHPKGELTKYKLAKISDCSYPSVHRILKKLEESKLVKGTKVKNFQEIINIWKNWKVRRDIREYVINNPIEILKKTNLQYALTTYHAENLVQGYLFPSRVDVYVKQQDKLNWHNFLMKQGALVGKGNLRIIMTDEQTFYNLSYRQGFVVVSIPQLIIDLLREGGTCIEAANILLEKVET